MKYKSTKFLIKDDSDLEPYVKEVSCGDGIESMLMKGNVISEQCSVCDVFVSSGTVCYKDDTRVFFCDRDECQKEVKKWAMK